MSLFERLLGGGGGGGGGERQQASGVVNVMPEHVAALLEHLRRIAEAKRELNPVIGEVHQLEESVVKVIVPTPHSAVLDARYSSDVVFSKLSSALAIIEEYVYSNLSKLEELSDEEKLRVIMKASKVASVVAAETIALLHSLILWNLPARARPALYNNLIGIEVL